MKVALIHNLYGAYSHGGAETIVEMMANDFKKAGHEVFLITSKPRRDGLKATTEEMENEKARMENGKMENGKIKDGKARMENEKNEKTNSKKNDLKIYYLNSEFYNLARRTIACRLFWHLGNIFSFRKYGRIKKILKTEKPDLVITHNLMGLGFLTPLVIKRLKINWRHFLHDIQLIHPSGLTLWGEEKKLEGLGAKIYQALTRALFASPTKIISPSHWLLEMHKKRGFFKKSAMEIKPFTWPLANQLRAVKTGKAQKFLFIGQIETAKGVFLLIKAFKKISHPDISLTFAIRDGGTKIAAAKQAAAEDERIKFIGPLSYEEAEKIKAESDCLIVPSLCYENSPTVIYGARAAGLCVIAAKLGGIPEIVGPDDKLFRPGDEDDLREKIKEMI